MFWLLPAVLAVAAILVAMVKIIGRRKSPPDNKGGAGTKGVVGGNDTMVEDSGGGVKPPDKEGGIEDPPYKPPAETDKQGTKQAPPPQNPPLPAAANSEQQTQKEKSHEGDSLASPDNECADGDDDEIRISPPPKPKTTVKDNDKATPAPPEPPGEHPPRKSPPGIVCWKNHDQQWVVGVEARPELAKLKATQNGEAMEKEMVPHGGGAEAFVCLRLDAPVEVDWEEDGEAKTCSPRTPCERGAFAMFSMRSNWRGIGRRVGHMTGGCHIVIAPRAWNRIGSPPVADEAFRDGEWRAHFFKPEHGEKDGFLLPNGKEKLLGIKPGRFELRGAKMSGTHPDAPPLFGAPPKIHDRQKWGSANEIVVGGENLDGRSPPPPSGDCDLDCLPLFIGKLGGFFAVRVDDNNGEGLDSQLDFYFMRGLRAIDIHNVRLLPNSGGHGTAKITFQGDCKIASMESREDIRLSGCAAEIAPHPDNDSTRWEIRNGGAKVEIEVLLERIWWALGLEGEAPAEWGSSPLALPIKDVSVTANNGLWIRLPRAGFAKNVYIGFSGEIKPYPVTARERLVFAPLSEFAIAAQQGGGNILLGMSPDNESDAATVARVIENIGTKPQVVRSGRRREGKGFSMAELAAAGWTLARAGRKNLPVDTRRKSAHNWNVDTLTAIGGHPK